MRNLFLLLIGFILVSANAFSQSCNCFVAVDSTYQIVPMTLGPDPGSPPNYHCNNCSSPAISLPFNFCFYGTNYNSVYIDNKGCLTFINPDFDFSTTGFPLGLDTLMIAPFYSDISDTPPNPASVSFSDIFYKITPTRLIVQWNTVMYSDFDDDYYNNFQVIITNGSDSALPPGNNVSFCYELMNWASGDSSGGSMGWDGAPAFIGVCKGDGIHYAQFGAFDFAGYSYFGPFDTAGETYWLDGKSFTFNTCVSGNTIPPVIVNPDSCSAYTICAGDTLTFNAFFLCPQKGQTATLSVSDSGLTGVVTVTGITDSLYSISGRLIATLSDTGTHVISLTATDNSSPALSNTRQIAVTVLNCSDTGAGIHELTVDNPQVTVFPNPNSGMFTVICHSERSEESLSIIEIYNVLGERVSTETLRSAQGDNLIDLSSQPNGVYFYRVIANSGELMGEGKVVIQK